MIPFTLVTFWLAPINPQITALCVLPGNWEYNKGSVGAPLCTFYKICAVHWIEFMTLNPIKVKTKDYEKMNINTASV